MLKLSTGGFGTVAPSILKARTYIAPQPHSDVNDRGEYDLFYGGAGSNWFIGDATADTMYGEGGRDILDGGDGDNWLYGGDGNDVLTGGSDTDRLFGGADDDRISGGAGADFLDGGDGVDIADYSASTYAVTVNLAKNSGLGGDAHGDRLFNIEVVYGSRHDDVLVGDDHDNLLYGLAGLDEIRGGGGDDVIAGGSNPLAGPLQPGKFVDPFAHGDQLWGDGGNDTFEFRLYESGGLKEYGILNREPDLRGIDTIHDFDMNGDDVLRFQTIDLFEHNWFVTDLNLQGTPYRGALVEFSLREPGTEDFNVVNQVFLSGVWAEALSDEDVEVFL
ncbi:MAG: calcium-binding protein [Pseudomonadota bacterium]